MSVRTAIRAPEKMIPRQTSAGQGSVQMPQKGLLSWFCEVGEHVEQGQIIAEGEVGKRTFEIPAPCGGRLEEQVVADEEVFSAGEVLGYIDPD